MEGSGEAAAVPSASREATSGFPRSVSLPATPSSGVADYCAIEVAFHAAGEEMTAVRAKLSALGQSWTLLSTEKGECRVV